MNRINNFDFLRLLFASFVIITHSYSLSGIKENDWLKQISQNQISFSALGVSGFFVISGFLIFQSLERSHSIFNFYWKRILRLFPGLIGVLVFTLLLALLFSTNKVPYYQNQTLKTYFFSNLFLFNAQAGIEGVFETLPISKVMNGSLWTIPYEVTIYFCLSLLFFVRNSRKITSFLVLMFLSSLVFVHYYYGDELGKFQFNCLNGIYLTDLSIYFFSGVALSVFQIWKLTFQKTLLIFSSILFVFSFFFHFFEGIKYIVLPLGVVLFGIQPSRILSVFCKKIGDLSYGLYLYGFLIQQTLMHLFGFAQFNLMIFGLLISLIFAWFSWYFIESKALKYKDLWVNLTFSPK
jgi:peptidoglycan/LPS O-acetylase OafA/YrhL